MPCTTEKKIRAHCPRSGSSFHFDFYETYYEIGDTGMAELIQSLCPRTAAYKENDKPQCNGYITPGLKCPYANSDKKSPVPFPKY